VDYLALREIIIGLISAAIAAALAFSWRYFRKRVKRRRALREHPIDGIYASSYSDNVAGQNRTIRDQISLHQHGLDFTGTSRNLSTGRSFVLKGQIVDDRFLTGTYEGSGRADSASGVFFMQLNLLNQGLVTGLWAGFGAEAGEVLSGVWNWRKLDQVIVSPLDASPHSIDEAAALFQDSLGKDFIRRDELKQLIQSPEAIIFAARNGENGLVGVCTATLLSKAEALLIEEKARSAGLKGVHLTESRIGLLKSTAVAPSSRNRGIGLKLLESRLQWLKRQGCTSVVTLSWDSGSNESSRGLLEAAEFEAVGVLPEYWREPDGEYTFECMKCGSPCTCSAVLMRRSLYNYRLQDQRAAFGLAAMLRPPK
jgi:N-acetylglutamate synthase-like GNAT family acetyltransferase